MIDRGEGHAIRFGRFNRLPRQTAHPELTLTGLYNVLEKLRAGEPLNDKDKKIHELGLVTLLKQIHDELDEAVLEAYRWGDLKEAPHSCGASECEALPNDVPFASRQECGGSLKDALLTRLVALNHERAAEEKRGLIRWLRPEYQRGGDHRSPSPPEAGIQQDPVGTETSITETPKPRPACGCTDAAFALAKFFDLRGKFTQLVFRSAPVLPPPLTMPRRLPASETSSQVDTPKTPSHFSQKYDSRAFSMKTNLPLTAGIAFALLISPALVAEEPTPEITGLQKAAADFVTAYNQQDSEAIAALFTEDGEMTDLSGANLTSGREQIQARYEEIFAENPLQIAIEVDSARLVAPNLAIEDGTFHLTPADDESVPPKSTTYTAVLTRGEDGVWRIASTRSLRDVTETAGRLAGLAELLKGEWTYSSPEGVRLDLAFGWDPTGKYIAGQMLTTTADAEPQEGSIRIAWDPSKQQIVSWMFDAMGGFTHGVWTPDGDNWLIHSEGTTADGETLSANQQLSTEDQDTLIWAATQRVIDGEKDSDKTFRMVRQAPEPSEE